MKKTKRAFFRIERDFLGELSIPRGAYYGIQTQRAFQNFPISGLKARPQLIMALAMVKRAATEANMALGSLDKKRALAIIKASEEVINGGHLKEFIVDAYNSGAGTSLNMNANEVIANRAIEMLGGARGDYSIVHPNDHVNMSQSSNDVIPTAIRIAAIISSAALLRELKALSLALGGKSAEFRDIVKSGRTHFQDAAPITLGAEFSSYRASIDSAIGTVKNSLSRLMQIGLGATAVGTGINTHPKYKVAALKALREITGIRCLKKARNACKYLSSADDFLLFSASLRGASVELIRIANDLRLLSSGPNTGLREITLPPVQPGSSIMPGKVNPVIPEMLVMVCCQVIGNDQAVLVASQAGSLELNVMTPVICQNILTSVALLSNAAGVFNKRCVAGIKADRQRCRQYFEDSSGVATALNRFIGYGAASDVAKEATGSGRSVKEIVIEKKIMSEREWDGLVSSGAFLGPYRIKTGTKRGTAKKRRG
ncbi:MAG: aspartate ammonia-lyase [Deltaproteobacteria bacterium]